MALAPGVRLGPYEIVSALGAGGMGEVWSGFKENNGTRFLVLELVEGIDH